MIDIVLHVLVLAAIIGAPALDRWITHHYNLSTRWSR